MKQALRDTGQVSRAYGEIHKMFSGYAFTFVEHLCMMNTESGAIPGSQYNEHEVCYYGKNCKGHYEAHTG